MQQGRGSSGGRAIKDSTSQHTTAHHSTPTSAPYLRLDSEAWGVVEGRPGHIGRTVCQHRGGRKACRTAWPRDGRCWQECLLDLTHADVIGVEQRLRRRHLLCAGVLNLRCLLLLLLVGRGGEDRFGLAAAAAVLLLLLLAAPALAGLVGISIVPAAAAAVGARCMLSTCARHSRALRNAAL